MWFVVLRIWIGDLSPVTRLIKVIIEKNVHYLCDVSIQADNLVLSWLTTFFAKRFNKNVSLFHAGTIFLRR